MVPSDPARHSDEDTVASHASALKAHRQNVQRRERNRQLRSRLRNALRVIREAIDKEDYKTAQGQLKVTSSLVDRMVAKGVVHKNAAARYKSRLQTRVSRGAQAA
jgi:small subunit ribosomal protein S20